MADAPKAHESLSTEARRVPVQGTPISPVIVNKMYSTNQNSYSKMIFLLYFDIICVGNGFTVYGR